jgi:hypothetical protein
MTIDRQSLSADIAESFLDAQIKEWPVAANNYHALSTVQVKSLTVAGMNMKVQYNPARIVSSGAKVDTASIKARPCFLCEANRPVQQQGVVWGDYTLLINPFPIFPRHFTIPANKHIPQQIMGRIADMMHLAQLLDGYTVFYNGPKCGASAPDHMHFQAGNTDFLTLPAAIDNTALTEVISTTGASLSIATDLPLGVFVVDATDINSGQKLFDRLYGALPTSDDNEPLLNILCHTTATGVIRLLVIPRVLHRPSCYGVEGADTMMLSPASVDVGGVFITPLEKDFIALTADKMEAILREVCMSRSQLTAIAKTIQTGNA